MDDKILQNPSNSVIQNCTSKNVRGIIHTLFHIELMAPPTHPRTCLDYTMQRTLVSSGLVQPSESAMPPPW